MCQGTFKTEQIDIHRLTLRCIDVFMSRNSHWLIDQPVNNKRRITTTRRDKIEINQVFLRWKDVVRRCSMIRNLFLFRYYSSSFLMYRPMKDIFPNKNVYNTIQVTEFFRSNLFLLHPFQSLEIVWNKCSIMHTIAI